MIIDFRPTKTLRAAQLSWYRYIRRD